MVGFTSFRVGSDISAVAGAVLGSRKWGVRDGSAPSRRRPLAAGFTLIELLVVVLIIAILASLIIPVAGLVRRRAGELDTANRLEHVLRELASRGAAAGGAVIPVQAAAGLGGALQFANLRSISHLVARPASGSATGREDAPDFDVDWDPILDSGFGKYKRVGKAGAAAVELDVQPPAQGPVAADWYLQQWPFSWPETDWYAEPPGTTPPILAHPWGETPLALDGVKVDPQQPPGAELRTLEASAGVRRVRNSWMAVTDHAGTIWQWSRMENGAAQTRSLPAGVADSVQVRRSDAAAGSWTSVPGNAPMPFDLGWCSPLATPALLQTAGVLPPGPEGLAAWRQDRSPTQPWNDAWGNPLVIVFALWQPPRAGDPASTSGMMRRDFYLKAASTVYGGNRALYLAGGSAGYLLAAPLPVVWSTPEDDRRVLRDLWFQIRADADAAEWTEQAWQDPPWDGVRRADGPGRQRAILTTPIVLR
jgi:prepilin-type N-terminal cleavage/methylation domain-containing protein